MNTGPQRMRGLWIALFAVIGIGVWSYKWMIRPNDENRGLMRYVRQVTNSVSPHELQRWAVGILRTNDWSGTNSVWQQDVSSSAIIHRIPMLAQRPAQVWMNAPTKENGYEASMSLVYLGGFGSWAINVGDEAFYLNEGKNCYQWIPGVYITVSP